MLDDSVTAPPLVRKHLQAALGEGYINLLIDTRVSGGAEPILLALIGEADRRVVLTLMEQLAPGTHQIRPRGQRNRAEVVELPKLDVAKPV